MAGGGRNGLARDGPAAPSSVCPSQGDRGGAVFTGAGLAGGGDQSGYGVRPNGPQSAADSQMDWGLQRPDRRKRTGAPAACGGAGSGMAIFLVVPGQLLPRSTMAWYCFQTSG